MAAFADSLVDDREAALQQYREKVLERNALEQNIKWLRAQLRANEGQTEDPLGSDLLFLADYACAERHVAVRGTGAAPLLELTVRQRMERMSTVLWPSGC